MAYDSCLARSFGALEYLPRSAARVAAFSFWSCPLSVRRSGPDALKGRSRGEEEGEMKWRKNRRRWVRWLRLTCGEGVYTHPMAALAVAESEKEPMNSEKKLENPGREKKSTL